MQKKQIASGVAHHIPADLRKTITADNTVLTLWNNLTPLARNEWICWVIDAKQTQTRRSRTKRVCTELKAGKQRPCCWGGCPHRKKNGTAVVSRTLPVRSRVLLRLTFKTIYFRRSETDIL